MTLNEFELIESFFANEPIHRDDVILGIGDDGAILNSSEKKRLVVTTDTLIAGTHFPENTPAFDIGFKSLAVNLSDLAAMGATPLWFTLALTLPHANSVWLSEFREGLFSLAKKYHLQLIGGDTTRGFLSITITALGSLPSSLALTRRGAKPNDQIYVTNCLGDAALALALQQKKISVPFHLESYFLNRLNQPNPRIEIGEKLLHCASAAIDISDGLASDLSHILKQSDVGAIIYCDQLPLSAAMKETVSKMEAITYALSGGDDYELCFTIPPHKKNQLPENCHFIGEITETNKLDLRMSDGSSFKGSVEGFKHFG